MANEKKDEMADAMFGELSELHSLETTELKRVIGGASQEKVSSPASSPQVNTLKSTELGLQN